MSSNPGPGTDRRLSHRAGAVRVQETAVTVAGLAAAGYEKEAGSLLRGVLAAAEAFGHRLPETYAGEQRTGGGAPAPHPAACRPSATSAAAGVLLPTALVGVRPDAPPRTVTLRPLRSRRSERSALQGCGSPAPPSPFGSAGSDWPWSRRPPTDFGWERDLGRRGTGRREKRTF